MLRIALLFIGAAASSAATTHAGKPLTPSEKAIIEHAVRAELMDPDSAQFRLGPDHPEAKAKYCGLVNAKNGYGGYTGYKLFTIFVDRDAKGHITDASYPDIQTEDGAFMRAALIRANTLQCKEAGFNTDY